MKTALLDEYGERACRHVGRQRFITCSYSFYPAGVCGKVWRSNEFSVNVS